MDGNLAMAVTGGSVSIASIIIGVIVWSLKRNVQHEDDAKRANELRHAENDKRMDAIEEAVRKRELAELEMRNMVSGISTGLGEIKGLVSSLTTSFETSRDKQAAHYREELAKLEHQFRSDLTRLFHPDLPERMSKVEARLERLEDRLPSRRGKK